jgi:hypothetical protein
MKPWKRIATMELAWCVIAASKPLTKTLTLPIWPASRPMQLMPAHSGRKPGIKPTTSRLGDTLPCHLRDPLRVQIPQGLVISQTCLMDACTNAKEGMRLSGMSQRSHTLVPTCIVCVCHVFGFGTVFPGVGTIVCWKAHGTWFESQLLTGRLFLA